MPTKNLLRHIFRHSTPESTTADTIPPAHKPHTPAPTTKPAHNPSLPKTPEPFGLSDIKEEPTRPNTPSTASLSTLSQFAQELHTFTPRELIDATLYEAKCAASSHLDTLTTTLAVLDALEGFSPTIKVLGEEMREKKRVCEEQVETLDAVGRCVAGMGRAGEECVG